MKIAITSKKGGATKSTQAKEIAYRYGLPIIDLDIDSHLKETYPKLDITKLKENEMIPHFDKVIYDFPAGDIFTKFPNTVSIIKSCDMVIIPTLYAGESVDRAIDTYENVVKHNDNILFVLSQCRNIDDLKDTKEYIESSLNTEIAITSIKYSVGMENAEDNSTNIFDIASKANKLIKRNYDRGIIKDYEELFSIIDMATEEG